MSLSFRNVIFSVQHFHVLYNKSKEKKKKKELILLKDLYISSGVF
jgi:hypothetical protein